MIMGNAVLMPWPISGALEYSVMTPSGEMRRNALGANSLALRIRQCYALLADVKRQHQAAAGEAGNFQEGATIDLAGRGLRLGGEKHVLHVRIGGQNRRFGCAHDGVPRAINSG